MPSYDLQTNAFYKLLTLRQRNLFPANNRCSLALSTRKHRPIPYVHSKKHGRNTVPLRSQRFHALAMTASAIAVLVCSFATPLSAQERRAPQTAGVDKTKMGPYRALAQLAYAASQKGDYANAATLAVILERTWDKAEDYGGDTALSKTNHALFDQIDKAMDQFIAVFMDHPTSAPEAAKLKGAYTLYLEKLRLAD